MEKSICKGELTWKEAFAYSFHPLKNPILWIASGGFAIAVTYYSYVKWTRESYKALQNLPEKELNILYQSDEGRDGLDVKELRDIFQDYKLEKREIPLQLPEVPRFGMTLEKKVEKTQ